MHDHPDQVSTQARRVSPHVGHDRAAEGTASVELGARIRWHEGPLASQTNPRSMRDSEPVGRAGLSMAVLDGGLALGTPSYDAVLAEHVPVMPGGGSCRSCGCVYTDLPVCPALILAAAGYPDLADRIRVVPDADREYGALCELTVAVERMGARLDIIGASVAAATPGKQPRAARRWGRLVGSRT